MIDPNAVNTVRVGELPPADFNLADNMPHEIDTELYRGTVQQLADLIGSYLGTSGSLAFNPTTVSDGGTLPETTFNEWMLVGKGTFHNVGGGLDILTTEELNAVTSNGAYWSLAVQIPINVELAGIVQTIRSGYLQTTPSEDAVFRALALKLNITDLPASPTTDTVINVSNVAGLTASDVLNGLNINKSNIATVNILDYGAIGDGTTDNTTAIQNALNSGKNVFVPDGSFLVSSTLLIHSFQTLSGQSLNAEIKTNLNIELISNSLVGAGFIERAVIKDIKLTNRYPVTAGAGATNWTVKFQNALHCTMDNVHVLGNFLDGDYNVNNKGGAYFYSNGAIPFVFLNTVKNCLFDKAAIRIETSDSDVLSTWVWAHPLGTPGIDLQSSNISVQFCNGIIPTRETGGIYLSPNAGLCRIENNFFDGSNLPVQSGWAIVSESNTDNIITGNTFWNCGRGGIKITDGALYTISNNSFRDNNRQDNSYSDILIVGSTFGTASITATGNTFWRNISHTNKAYAIQEQNSGAQPLLNNYSNNKINGQYLSPAILSNVATTWGVQGGSVIPYINNAGDYVGINSSLIVGDGSDKSNTGLTDNDIIAFNKGSNIQARKGFPQFAFSANTQGNWYAPTYKTNNPASQIVIDGLGGTIQFNRAVSGLAGGAMSWLESGSFSNSGVFKVNNLAGTTDEIVVSDLNGALKKGGAAPTSGTYTPTFTAIVNCSGVTQGSCTYTRVGNVINVSVRFSLTDLALTTDTSFRVSLPVNRTSSSAVSAIGSGVINSSNGLVKVSFDTANNSTAIVSYNSGTGFGSKTGYVNFQYLTTE